MSSIAHSTRALPLVTSLAVLAYLGVTGVADVEAHPNHGPTLGERYLKLDLSTERVRVVYGLTYSAQKSGNVRRAADADRDGVVSSSESRAQSKALVTLLDDRVILEVDSVRTALAWGTPFVGGLEGETARGPITLEVVGTAALTGAHERFVLRDRAEFDGVYRTTATIALSPDIELVHGGEGVEPRTAQRRVAFLDLPGGGPAPARVVTAVVRFPAQAAGSDGAWTAAWRWWAAGAALIGALSLLVVVVWRKKRRRGATARGRDSAR